jgi:protein involved in polysaccharide export with SLBB domain
VATARKSLSSEGEGVEAGGGRQLEVPVEVGSVIGTDYPLAAISASENPGQRAAAKCTMRECSATKGRCSYASVNAGDPAQAGNASPHWCPRMNRFLRSTSRQLAGLSLAVLLSAPALAPAQTQNDPQQGSQTLQTSTDRSATSGPVRLRQGNQDQQQRNGAFRCTQSTRQSDYKPGEFEEYVQRMVGQMASTTTSSPSDQQSGNPSGNQAQPDVFDPQLRRAPTPKIRRLGAELMIDPCPTEDPDYNPLVPADYIVQAGDELLVTLWGSVDADLRPIVDRSGSISIPRVGTIMVAGVRYAELRDVIARRVGQVFKNFQLSVSLGQLRGVRIYVTGFVLRPGAYTVSSLSTIAGALIKAGGPSAAGSFRTIQLRRGRTVVSNFDFYDLLLKGDRSNDRVVQPDDVIHVGPLGTQVALIGSVNQPAIFELKPGETVTDVLRMAGGLTAVADPTRLAVERLDDRATTRITQLELPQSLTSELRSGDVVRAFNSVLAVLPVERQNKRVRIEGEVLRPGEYVLPARSSINDALGVAGGLTSAAYIYGTEFSRESVRLTQQENYERALRDLELEFAKSSTTLRTNTADEAAAQSQRSAGTTRLIERLRSIKPTGRVVLQVPPDSRELPDLALEDGDRIYVPARPSTVGVFGSVFNGGSYLWSERRNMDDYLRLAAARRRVPTRPVCSLSAPTAAWSATCRPRLAQHPQR